MKKCITCIVIGLLVLLTSCTHDKAIRQMCEDMHTRYPLATLQDIYKTCYQDHFGAEHLVNDTAAARHYLSTELEECHDVDMSAMPKREPTGFQHRFVRVNLSCVVDGELTEEELLTMFLDAAGKDNQWDANWAEEWNRIERIALSVNPKWADPQLQSELQTAARDNQAVRHSASFRDTYHPHYRIVRATKE